MSSPAKYNSYARARIGDRVFNSLNLVLMIAVVFVSLYPFWNTIAVSFNDATDTIRGGINFWPRKFTWQNYKAVFAGGAIGNAFVVSVERTLLQTVLNVFLTSMLAYSLSRKEFVLRKPFTTVLILSMYLSAGLIPQYFLMRGMHLINSFWVYIVPGLLSAYNFILVRTQINSLPDSFVESARIDGAGDFKIFINIILPLIVPVLATVSLFVAVGSWNSWFDTMIYNSSRVELHTLQYKLMEYLQSSQNQAKSAAQIGAMGMAADAQSNMVTPVSIRAAITVVAAVPILVVYPFVQRYFVTGMNVGGVKE